MYMVTRRSLLISSAAAMALRGATMTSKERVDRALKGEDVDRPPFSFWHHFLDAAQPGEEHARSTLEFHQKFHTDLVKVMSDYPYPKPKADWYALQEHKDPFPQQIVALEKIRNGLAGRAYFVETLFNPWKVAENLSSVEEVRKLQHEKPQALLDALEVIAKSEANHARRSIAAGAAGVFVAIANAQDGYMTQADYAKFSEPFDKMVFDAVRSAPRAAQCAPPARRQGVSGSFLSGLGSAGDQLFLARNGSADRARTLPVLGCDPGRTGRSELPQADTVGPQAAVCGCAQVRRGEVHPHSRLLGAK